MSKEIPKEYKNQFKSFEEFKEFMMNKAKNELVMAGIIKRKLKNEKYNG